MELGTRLGVVVAAVGLGLSACAYSPVTVNNASGIPGLTNPVAAAAPAPPATPVVMQLALAPVEDERDNARRELDEATRALQGVSMFFETDQATLTKDAKVRLLRVADVLKRYPQLRIRIEGNADERGTAEYNRALAEKRARAAKDYLLSIAVSGDQVIVVSNGAEKPLAPGAGEENWELNRRNDVVPVDERK